MQSVSHQLIMMLLMICCFISSSNIIITNINVNNNKEDYTTITAYHRYDNYSNLQRVTLVRGFSYILRHNNNNNNNQVWSLCQLIVKLINKLSIWSIYSNTFKDNNNWYRTAWLLYYPTNHHHNHNHSHNHKICYISMILSVIILSSNCNKRIVNCSQNHKEKKNNRFINNEMCHCLMIFI